MRKNLVIDSGMKELWRAVRVGCLQYKVSVGEKNDEMWKYLKKDIFRKVKDDIFDHGVNEIPNIKEIKNVLKENPELNEPLPCIFGSADPEDRTGEGIV